ncbi:MAG: hypothetical protein EOO04_06400 [Chitinophagaceae bacterium]|nr:MAG: hypothetical protein EOO04_06400 [Chitinophagaceae bacterium]
MVYSDNYGRQFGDRAELLLERRIFPNELIEEWWQIIKDILDGYCSTPPELDLDLSRVRNSIEVLLVDGSLTAFAEHNTFKEDIDKLDEEYISLTQVYPPWVRIDSHWWSTRILKSACKEYIDFFGPTVSGEYGLTIQAVE